MSRSLLMTVASPELAETAPQAPFTADEERLASPEGATLVRRAPAPRRSSTSTLENSEELENSEKLENSEELEKSEEVEEVRETPEVTEVAVEVEKPARRSRRVTSAGPPRAAGDESGEELPTSPRIVAELRLIQAAERAQREGDYARALERLREHEKTFPKGQLQQEREASRISALCRLGGAKRARAVELAAEFLRRWPSSHLAQRVRRACPEVDG